jgi:hypothetical protein
MYSNQCCGSGSFWEVRIRIKVKIQELWRLKIEPSRAMDPHSRVMESQIRAIEGL